MAEHQAARLDEAFGSMMEKNRRSMQHGLKMLASDVLVLLDKLAEARACQGLQGATGSRRLRSAVSRLATMAGSARVGRLCAGHRRASHWVAWPQSLTQRSCGPHCWYTLSDSICKARAAGREVSGLRGGRPRPTGQPSGGSATRGCVWAGPATMAAAAQARGAARVRPTVVASN